MAKVKKVQHDDSMNDINIHLGEAKFCPTKHTRFPRYRYKQSRRLMNGTTKIYS